MSSAKIFILFALAFLPGSELGMISETDWTEVTTFSKFYHYRGSTSYYFDDAKSYCESKGGILWQPFSKEEELFVKTETNASYTWIGVTRVSGTGSYHWITAGSIGSSYSNWHDNHPGAGKTLAYFSTKWVSTSSSDTNNVVCESSPFGRLESMISAISTRLNALETKSESIDTKISSARSEISTLSANIDTKIMSARSDISSLSNEIDNKIATLLEEQQCSMVIDIEPVE